jgi:hypothetical protein
MDLLHAHLVVITNTSIIIYPCFTSENTETVPLEIFILLLVFLSVIQSISASQKATSPVSNRALCLLCRDTDSISPLPVCPITVPPLARNHRFNARHSWSHLSPTQQHYSNTDFTLLVAWCSTGHSNTSYMPAISTLTGS